MDTRRGFQSSGGSRFGYYGGRKGRDVGEKRICLGDEMVSWEATRCQWLSLLLMDCIHKV